MLNNLDNLIFFNDNGLQLKVDKSYNLLWTISQDISDPLVKIDSEISGFVIGDEYTGMNSRPSDSSLTYRFEVLNKGCIKFNKNIVSEYNQNTAEWEDNSFFTNTLSSLKSLKENYLSEDSTLTEKEAEEKARITYIKMNLGLWLTNFTFFPYINNSVVDALDYWTIINNNYVVNGQSIGYIYDYNDPSTSIIKDIKLVERKFYEDADDIPDYYEYYVESIEVSDLYKQIVEEWLVDCNLNKISKDKNNPYSLFPFISYVGTLNQEKVSADLVASNTLFILNETEDGQIIKPYNSDFNLTFAFANDAQCKFVEANYETDEVTWKTSITVDIDSEDSSAEGSVEPISFSIGFIADEEGVYQNLLHIYLQRKSNPNILYNLGAINIKTEVEGEDERYRTLFANFGIPDPITYPNLFKEKDPDEELVDYELVNRKSKELFLSYNEIFPYVGTYKALINAVKFLGYDDVFFREWYKVIKNESTHSPYNEVSYQSIDIENKTTLESKLKSINVTYEEFLNYKKLNKLSLVYYFNKVDEDSEYDVVTYKSIVNGQATTQEKYIEIPSTFRVYDYTGDALLAKLLSLKKWLEKFIIGINCHIADVTGEGVYFYRVENYAYHTNYNLLDYKKEGYLTPNFIETETTRMINSSAYLRCSLNEFDALKISDYEKTPIRKFVRKIADFNSGKYYINNSSIYNYIPEYSFIESEIPVSNPIEALVPYNELSFEVNTSNNIGSLFEQFSDLDKDRGNLIYINNGKIVNYNEYSKSTSFYNKPIIDIELANIRNTSSNWNDNIVYTIKSVVDQNTGDLYYQVKDTAYNVSTNQYTNHFILIPDGDSAELKYSEENRFNLPLFIFKNYKFYKDSGEENTYFEKDKEYILEILDGKLLFDNLKVEGTDDEFIGQELQFIRHKTTEALQRSDDYDKTQDVGSLEVLINTTYESPRKYIYRYEPLANNDLIYEYNNIIEDYNNKVSINQEQFINNRIREFVNRKLQENDLMKYLMNLKDKVNESSDIKSLSTIEKFYLLGLKTCGSSEKFSYTLMYNAITSTLTGDQTDEQIKLLSDLNGDGRVNSADLSLFNNLWDNETYITMFLNTYIVSDEAKYNGTYYLTLNDISEGLGKFLLSQLNSTDVGVKDTVEQLFINDDCELIQYIQYKWNLYIKQTQKEAYDNFVKTYKSENYYNFNKYTGIKVNRFGEYTLVAKAFDEYNNVYTAVAGNSENVYGLPQVIDTYINSEYSNMTTNKNAFGEIYRGESVDEEVEDFIVNRSLSSQTSPLFPKSYRIFDIEVANDSITYDNISFATNLDFIGEDCYVYLNNFTDKSANRLWSVYNNSQQTVNAYVRPYAYNYSTNSQRLIFNTSTLKSQSVDFIVYDDVLKQVENEIYINSAIGSSLGLMTINNLTTESKNILQAAFNSNTKSVYIIASDYIKIDSVNGFSSDEDSDATIIKIDENLFNVGDVVKLTYVYPNNGVLTGYMYDNVLGQEAFRVVDKFFENDKWNYTLNSKFNSILTELFTLDVYISRGNTKFVNYELKVKTADCVNRVVDNVYNDTVEYKTTIKYNYNDWFASDYLDNSYSMYITDYNPLNLFTDWVNPYDELINEEQIWEESTTTSIDTDYNPSVPNVTTTTAAPYYTVNKWAVDMWKYQNKTLVLNQDKNVVITSEDVNSTFGGSYKSLWNVYVDSIEELDWKYGSVLNDVVFIKTNILGENTWRLTTIDKYGNTLFIPASQKLIVLSEN